MFWDRVHWLLPHCQTVDANLKWDADKIDEVHSGRNDLQHGGAWGNLDPALAGTADAPHPRPRECECGPA
jgi:hypothetical protein